jgi:hypothetical protein
MNKILLFLGMLIWSHALNAQVNIFGKPGHIMTPSAYWQDNKHLGLSFAYVPASYGVNGFMGTLEDAQIVYSARVAMADFVEVNLNITRIPALSDSIGIGDRHLDIRIKLLEEKEILPALSIIISPPGSIAPHISHDVLVASKTFEVGQLGTIALTAGYGLPYYFGRASKNSGSGIWDKLSFTKKSKQGNNYLNGVFGAALWHPWDFLGLMAEHDSRNINFGAVLKLNDWLLLQAHSYELKKLGFSLALQVPLDFEPKELRSYGK